MSSPDSSSGNSTSDIHGASWRALLSALSWAFTGGAVTGGAWACGFVLAGAILVPPFSRPVDVNLIDEAIVWGPIGGLCGLVIGSILGSIRGNGDRTGRVVALGLVTGLAGALGGGLAPFLVVEAENVLSPLASSTLAWTIAGSIAGGIAFGISRLTRERHELDEEDVEAQSQPQSSTRLPERPTQSSAHKASMIHWPVFATSTFALVAAGVTAPSLAALVLLTNGLLGLSIAFASLANERRIRELEQQLGRRL